MKYALTALMAVGVVMLVAAPATADWDPGDPYKMHFPQMPDPNGWDVNFTDPKVLADDWACTETGPVSDIHFWFSVQGDYHFFQIDSIHVSIHDNKPADPEIPFSRPGALLWQRDFGPTEVGGRTWGVGQQGWYDPNTREYNQLDHIFIGQINIEKIRDPFIQQVDSIYWLDLSMKTSDQLGGDPPRLGWKTSTRHFMDDAVWGDIPAAGGPISWKPLYDPITGETLDLAFVITPEPGTVVMLVGAGLMGLVAYARRRRKR